MLPKISLKCIKEDLGLIDNEQGVYMECFPQKLIDIITAAYDVGKCHVLNGASMWEEFEAQVKSG